MGSSKTCGNSRQYISFPYWSCSSNPILHWFWDVDFFYKSTGFQKSLCLYPFMASALNLKLSASLISLKLPHTFHFFRSQVLCCFPAFSGQTVFPKCAPCHFQIVYFKGIVYSLMNFAFSIFRTIHLIKNVAYSTLFYPFIFMDEEQISSLIRFAVFFLVQFLQ